ncbi:MAG: PIN domain nuclease [Candidatus Nanopelagicales bacterium]
MRVLLDTSVLTRLRDPRVRSRVESLALARTAHVCAITSLEVGSSARNAQEFDTLLAHLRHFEHASILPGDFDSAQLTQRSLADRGHRGRKIPDLIIAAVAQRHGLTVLHYDRDFDLITECTGQPTEWVVARGEID